MSVIPPFTPMRSGKIMIRMQPVNGVGEQWLGQKIFYVRYTRLLGIPHFA